MSKSTWRNFISTVAATTVSAAVAMAFVQISTLPAWAGETEFAPMPSFDAPAIAVGVYRISAIVTTGRRGRTDRCSPASTETSSLCFRHFWVVRKKSQLAIIEAITANTEGDTLFGGFFNGMSIQRDCNSTMERERAVRGGIFEGNYCRAIGTASPQGETEKFLFSNSVPEFARLPFKVGTIQAFFMLGTGTSTTSRFTVELPRGEVSPKTIKITENVSALAIGIPTSYENTYTLDYVSN